ncbi:MULTISPECIES: phage tail protein [Kitasatospora]|uniref:phage tail protein n=1 Tax=Kitasatospora TaxID=2063 RepID=UPI000C714216|nr:phage tail protein [Kitasatospora sp. GP30]MDH6143530.1 phage tail-like protein [Kitasatospora sp. GP30]
MPELARRTDPFPGFRFTVLRNGQPIGGFSEVGGLQLETEVFDYPEGGVNDVVHKLPVRTKQTNLSLKRGLADRILWDWHDDVVSGRVTRWDVVVLVYDQAGDTPVAQWGLHRVYPVKWVGPSLNATQNQVAIETLELVHEGLKRMG